MTMNVLLLNLLILLAISTYSLSLNYISLNLKTNFSIHREQHRLGGEKIKQNSFPLGQNKLSFNGNALKGKKTELKQYFKSQFHTAFFYFFAEKGK